MCNNSGGGIGDRVCCTLPHVCADSVYEGGARLRIFVHEANLSLRRKHGIYFYAAWICIMDVFLLVWTGMAPSLRLSPASAISAGLRCAGNAGNSGWQGLQSAGR